MWLIWPSCLVPLQYAMGEAMSRRIRGVFNAVNFWTIVLYNVLALNSLEFAKLVGNRLIVKGTFISGIPVVFSQVVQIQLINWAYMHMQTHFSQIKIEPEHIRKRHHYASLSSSAGMRWTIYERGSWNGCCSPLSQVSHCLPYLCCWWPTVAFSWWRNVSGSKLCWRIQNQWRPQSLWRRSKRKQSKGMRCPLVEDLNKPSLSPFNLLGLPVCNQANNTSLLTLYQSSFSLTYKALFLTLKCPKVHLIIATCSSAQIHNSAFYIHILI